MPSQLKSCVLALLYVILGALVIIPRSGDKLVSLFLFSFFGQKKLVELWVKGF